MTTSTRTLHPIIRDQPGGVQPIPAAIAAITGQPLTAVARVLKECLADLKGMAGVDRSVSPEDACHGALHRFGYEPHRLYADVRRHRAMGELLGGYARAPGSCECLFALCESGDAFAFLGTQAASWNHSAPTELGALVTAGTLDMNAPVRFAFTVIRQRVVAPLSPDHKFLETVAIPALALADAYNIEVMPVGWPYWNLSFPRELTDGEPGSGAALVCGEHELLSVINDRVRLHQRADETTAALMAHLRRRPSIPSRD